MANTIKPKRSYTATNTPTLSSGEVGVNAADGKIWIGNALGTANVLVSSLAFSDHTGTVSDAQLSATAVTAASYTNANITVNAQGRITAASNGTAGGVTSVSMTVPTGLSVSGTPITSTGTLAVTLTSGYSIPTTASQTNWDSAYTQRLQWDGGSTNLVAATGRTSLGLGNVENTALSTWAGSQNITAVGAVLAKSVTINTPSASGSQGGAFVISAGTLFSLTASVESPDININLQRAVQFQAGNLSLQRAIRIQAPIYSFTGGVSTLTTAVTVQIDSAPVASSNATLTNSYALRVLTGTAAGVGIAIQGADSQSGDLFRIQNFGGTKLLYVDSNYSLYLARSLNLTPFNTSAGNTSEIRFYELAANGTNYVGFKAPDNIASNVIWTLPAADGTEGQVLSTNASGALSWVTPSFGSQTITLSGDVSGTGTTAITTTLATVPITKGGTGQVTATAAVNALLPAQTGNTGKYLTSDGTNTSWSTVTAGSSVTTSATAPVSPTAGDQWYDTNTGIIYTYINDGTSSQWVQGSTATLDTGVPAGGTTNQFLVKSGATDYATAWTGTLTNPTFTNYTETLYDAGTGSAFTINLSNGTIQKFTTNANMTLTLPASTAGKSFVVMVVYGAANTLTWSSPSTLKWVGGTTPTATSVTGKIDIFSFFQDGTNTYGTVYGQNF